MNNPLLVFCLIFCFFSKANFFSTEFNSLSAGFKEPKFIERFERMTDLSYVNLLKPWTYFFRYEWLNSLLLFMTKNMDNLKSLFLILRFQRSVREVCFIYDQSSPSSLLNLLLRS